MRNCNRERMTKLVEALESGEFEQARGQLRIDDKFCCLGVACEISGIGTWVDGYYQTANDYSFSVMPVDVVDYYGLDLGKDDMPLDGGSVASALNDKGYSFTKISRRIRETYLEEDDDNA